MFAGATLVPVTGAAAQTDTAAWGRAVHLLHRITFGPRPGDVERVLSLGIDAYLDAQLEPDRIADTAVATQLRRLAVLERSTDQLAREFQEARRERVRRQARAADDSMAMVSPTGQDSPMRRYAVELQQAALVRAVVSERQLYEVLVDFWVNHFNVFLRKGNILALLPEYVERTIRPRAMGTFEDLLIATAQSPAMLIYLDNALSIAPGSTPPALRRNGRGGGRPARAARPPAERVPTGLNENYGRELLELHTVGVDGGYTQDDVVNAARVFTGWTVRRPGGAAFVFNDWAHDPGTKTVLGREFSGGGTREGLELLRFLARHPATMRHVTGKLCMRFVSDVPPEGCIDAGVHAWVASGGEIRAVVRGILESPEFWAPEVRAAKVKTPLEFVASAVRAVGGRPDTTPRLALLVGRLGQPLYLQSAPTGYPEREESWVNSGALLDRFNTAIALAAGRMPGVTVDLGRLLPTTADLGDLVEQVNHGVLHGAAGEATLAAMRKQLATIRDPGAARALALGLALGSPEFQRQ
jgi:uncharacterized protein (DUF1800 family)